MLIARSGPWCSITSLMMTRNALYNLLIEFIILPWLCGRSALGGKHLHSGCHKPWPWRAIRSKNEQIVFSSASIYETISDSYCQNSCLLYPWTHVLHMKPHKSPPNPTTSKPIMLSDSKKCRRALFTFNQTRRCFQHSNFWQHMCIYSKRKIT